MPTMCASKTERQRTTTMRTPFLPAPLLLLAGGAQAADFVSIVHPRHKLNLSLPVAGVVAKVAVEPGRRVEAGQALILLDERPQTLEEQRRKTVLDDHSELRATEERLKIVQPLAEEAR